VAPTSTSRPSTSSSTSRKENIANTSSTSTVPKPRKAEDSAAVRALQEENRQLKDENANLQTQCTELETQIEEVEAASQTFQSERDFYFEKLRGIELLLQVFKEKEESGEDIDMSAEARRVIDKAFKVMYATEEDNVLVDDEGNVS
jgi:predicted RNase H-like nuclease (RuvC/YqgF family)